MGKLIVDGNQVYEIDEECMERKRKQQGMNKTDTDAKEFDRDKWKRNDKS